jgi:RNA polymerase sigma-B factor
VPAPPIPRHRLIEAHLPLVRSVARRYAASGEPLDDLFQVGAIGLIKAVDRYDIARGGDLGAYAAASIDGEIRHHLRDRSAPVRVPRRLQAEGLRVRPVPIDEDGAPAAQAVAAEDRIALAAAIRALRPRERRIVHLRYFADLSQAQIAAALGLSQVHVSRLLRGALASLHAELTSTNGEDARVAAAGHRT